MAIPRRKQIKPAATLLYHCSSRCVRQAYLCGVDTNSGRSFEHRRKWIEDRLLELSRAYCIDVAGYAIMSNHYHAILKIDPKLADRLTDDEVVDRWSQIHHLPPLLRLKYRGSKLSVEEEKTCAELVKQLRDNLSNLSRFMGDLNERIARMANREDQCKGRFWEGRFSCQAILGRDALLQTLCYVELNPVRAKMARTPEESKFTSFGRRLRIQKSGLIPFWNPHLPEHKQSPSAIPAYFEDYLNLLDWTGRLLRSNKRGMIDDALPPILERLGLVGERWIKMMNPQVPWFPKAVGTRSDTIEYAKSIDQQWLWRLPEPI